MRSSRSLAVVVLCACAAGANAQEPTISSSSCPISTLVTPVRYERLHQIPTKPAHGDVSHKIVTPGGMVLDTPKLVAAVDVLTIVARDEAVVCFGLLTFARDRHECELSGVAGSELGAAFVFRDGEVVVRFTFVGDDQVRVEPVGTGYRKRCQRSGEIQPAMYTRKPAAR